MLQNVQKRVIELLGFKTNISPLFIEGVVRFLEGHLEQLIPGHKENQYLEFLRAKGFGRNYRSIAQASLESWLLDECVMEMTILEQMLHGALEPTFKYYLSERLPFSPEGLASIEETTVVRQLLAAHTSWTKAPPIYGPVGDLEAYLIVAESIIRETNPAIAKTLGLHYSEFVEHSKGCSSYVQMQIQSKTRLSQLTDSFVGFWNLYISSIKEKVFIDAEAASRNELFQHWQSKLNGSDTKHNKI